MKKGELTIDWIKPEDEMPVEGRDLLLLYVKQNPTRSGDRGTFITQGHTETRETYSWEKQVGVVTEWNDYTGRLLCIHGGASKNKVIGWCYLPMSMAAIQK